MFLPQQRHRGARSRAFPVLGFAILLLCRAAYAQSAEIAGVVKAEDGSAIGSARIGIIDRSTGKMITAQSDPSGRFRVRGLGPERRYRVAVTRFGYETVTLENVRPGELNLSVTLARSPGPAPSNRATTPEPDDIGATFKVAVGLVTLNVTVRDAAGAPVRGLKQQDFRVFEQGKPQEIAHFGEESTPASVVLLFDTSSSMEGAQIAQARRAALEFVKGSGPADEMSLVAFNDKIQVLQPPTLDRAGLRSAIEKLTAHGGTALYDAIAHGIGTLNAAKYPRRVMLIFSDGIDADSGRKFSDVQRLVEASDVLIYAVGEYLGPERARFMTGSRYYKLPELEENYNPVWVLRQLADVSGGSASFPEPNEPLEPFFATIARELRDQYVLSYVPPPPSAEPEFRRIEVRVTAPGAEKYSVRTRKGYLSPGTERLSRKD